MTRDQIIAVRNVFKDMEALTDEEFLRQLEFHKDTELARTLEYAIQPVAEDRQVEEMQNCGSCRQIIIGGGICNCEYCPPTA